MEVETVTERRISGLKGGRNIHGQEDGRTKKKGVMVVLKEEGIFVLSLKYDRFLKEVRTIE